MSMESESCKYCGMSGAHSPEYPTQFKANEDDTAEKEKTRTLSDAKRITGGEEERNVSAKYGEETEEEYTDRGGAEYKIDKGAQRPRLEFTKEQVEEAETLMNADLTEKEREKTHKRK